MRDNIFAKAGSKIMPLLFIDDEFIGDWKKVEELSENGLLLKLFDWYFTHLALVFCASGYAVILPGTLFFWIWPVCTPLSC